MARSSSTALAVCEEKLRPPLRRVGHSCRNGSYQRTKLTGRRRKDVSRTLRYVLKLHRRGRMAYAEAKRRNYPVGTGITEAAAKTVVGTRMKRAGARYSQHGGQTVVLFRAVLSYRFDALHRELFATYTAQIAA